MKYFSELNCREIQNFLIILDIDGTITHDGARELSPVVKEKLKTLKRSNQIVLCSNKKNHDRNAHIAKITDLTYLKTSLRKPNVKIVKLIQNPQRLTLLVIGDKWLTDGRFAKRIGASFIKVRRLTSKRDSWIAKIIHAIDDMAAKIFA